MKVRTISAIILIAIITPLIYLGGIPFALVIGLIAVIATKEINDIHKYPILIKILSFLTLISIVYSNFDANTIIFGLEYKYLSILILALTMPIIFYQVKGKYTIEDAFKLIGFVLLVGLGLNYFILVRSFDLNYFLLMLLIPIMTDTFAYIAGMMIGKHKVTKLSPKKSWEGYIIGSLMGTFIMAMFYITVINNQSNLLIVIAIIFLLTVIGQIGDLIFSAIKRQYNIKDFANLIPGHGGILDRLDSLIIVAIAFVIFLEYL
ncbi:MAG: phosphatidate cytidylyltransferase [Bacilli bacterium]|nr:phosphatidate cytidylyltransferase [Bacilli bacterium]